MPVYTRKNKVPKIPITTRFHANTISMLEVEADKRNLKVRELIEYIVTDFANHSTHTSRHDELIAILAKRQSQSDERIDQLEKIIKAQSNAIKQLAQKVNTLEQNQNTSITTSE